MCSTLQTSRTECIAMPVYLWSPCSAVYFWINLGESLVIDRYFIVVLMFTFLTIHREFFWERPRQKFWWKCRACHIHNASLWVSLNCSWFNASAAWNAEMSKAKYYLIWLNTLGNTRTPASKNTWASGKYHSVNVAILHWNHAGKWQWNNTLCVLKIHPQCQVKWIFYQAFIEKCSNTLLKLDHESLNDVSMV